MHTTRNKSDRPRRKNDFYPTPYGLAYDSLVALLSTCWPSMPSHVLDAGCGKGVWMDAMWEVSQLASTPVNITGVDLEPHHQDTEQVDFLEYTSPVRYGLIMGNPPYNQMELFVRHSLESDLLTPNGMVFFLCRLEFLASKSRMYGLFKDHPLHRVYILSRRPSFFSTNGRRTTDAQDYAMYLWKKHPDDKPTEMQWLYWNYHPIHDVITEIDAGPKKDPVIRQGEFGFYVSDETRDSEVNRYLGGLAL